MCALLLNAEGRVDGDDALIFYNNLQSKDSSVRHGGEQTLGAADLFEELFLDLEIVADAVQRIAVCASIDQGTFARVQGLHVRLEGPQTMVFQPPPLETERAVVLFEVYRRAGEWRTRAIGQGYSDGLAGLARNYGISVD